MNWKVMLSPGLYVVATPIGNLEDISHRAVRVLGEVTCIAAEDTRHSRILLNHYGIGTPLLSLHEHNESDRTPGLVDRIRRGEAIALISDAGTPLISDPGFRLVNAMKQERLQVFSVPGPSAVTAALSIGGLATDRFVFEGFLPVKPAARRKRLNVMASENATLVFFESSHRIRATMADMLNVFGADRDAAICRELTKKFETVIRGSLADIKLRLETDPDQGKGEFVVLVAGNTEENDSAGALQLARALREYLPASKAAKVAARVTGTSRRELYAMLEDAEEGK
jgi:16S rRNA (cytidine1402-2'-O)-methyltransferase